MKQLFFSPEFSADFDWRERFHFRVGSVLPHNKKQISNGLRDMSPESIRNRFLGSKRAFTDKELQYLTLLDGWNHYAIGIEERAEPKRGIAIARLVRSSHSVHEAEVALTIIDAFQRKGLGSFLMNLIILAAMERDIHVLSFTFLPQNDGILRLIHCAGTPIPGPYNRDYQQYFLDLRMLDQEEVKSRLSSTLPVIGTFRSGT